MRRILWIAASIIAFFPACTREPGRTANPGASPEARRLLDFLYEVQGKYILAGQHNFISTGSKYTDLVKESTGKSPLIWGSDFSFCYEGGEAIRFLHSGPLNLSDPGDMTSFEALESLEVGFTGQTPHRARQNLVETVIARHREGFIITLMWHACPPGFGDCCDGNEIWKLKDRIGGLDWAELTTEGTVANNAWRAQADTVAFYLKELRDAGVPVLWRPYHQMNGVWFWWYDQRGGDGFKKLWIMMYDYYVDHHGLNNLLWVWNANAPRDIPGDEAYGYEEFWPGPEYVDVLAADIYRDDWKQKHHDDLVKLAGGKPVAIGVAAPPPGPEVLAEQAGWTWFMAWGNRVSWGNGIDIFRELFDSGKALAREDVIFENESYRINRKD
ncbi:MAG: glycosyl hydrolase family 26 [Acidobacteria bacterium]|nr:glycosyl hydrolase family 26 [Acidobacteriota bacterium]